MLFVKFSRINKFSFSVQCVHSLLELSWATLNIGVSELICSNYPWKQQTLSSLCPVLSCSNYSEQQQTLYLFYVLYWALPTTLSNNKLCIFSLSYIEVYQLPSATTNLVSFLCTVLRCINYPEQQQTLYLLYVLYWGVSTTMSNNKPCIFSMYCIEVYQIPWATTNLVSSLCPVLRCINYPEQKQTLYLFYVLHWAVATILSNNEPFIFSMYCIEL